MKKLVLIMCLLSLNAFADNEVNPNSYANNNCGNLKDPAEKKDCFDIEKRNEAEENFREFQQNSTEAYQENF